jgi:RHS repeat-associated protein
LNGNMTYDGATTYTWDARNRLGAFGSTTFAYDSTGRRTRNATGTAFLYDGISAVQELSGSTVTANLLTGGLDEVFTRTDSASTRNFLSDALGSTLALTDSTGTVQTQYAYEPFGKTTATGSASSSTFQYTGRENDGTGLYYYRARYYNPTLGRFISEDPTGLAGDGPDFYVYASDSPATWVDPSGLDAVITFWPNDAAGFGHVGIGINTNQTSGFYSVHRYWCLPFGCTDDGHVLPDVPDHPGTSPGDTFIIPTTPDQDRLMQQFIDQRTQNPGKYTLYGRNCVKFVEDALRAGGVKNVPTGLANPETFVFFLGFAASSH